MGGEKMEDLINHTIDTNDTTEDIEVDIMDIPTEDTEQEILTEELIDEIIIESEEEVVIDISESMGWVSGDNRYHDSLLGVDSPNQHPITAIRNLREELDEINRLKSVYSDKFNIANYYEWSDASYDEYGYFVSLVSDTSKIKICDGTDIFGVSVSTAGFIGGQDADVPRDNSYGLIVTSGLVDVRCELNVEVGDYVVSNTRGYAKKSDSNYGYRVLAKEEKNGVEYVVITLGIQADTIEILGTDLAQVKQQVDVNYRNIVSVTNVANQAYNKSVEASESAVISEDAAKKALESVLNTEKNINDVYKVLESTNGIAAQAKTIAETAVTSATSLRDEAVNRANDAWAKADKVETETYSLCAKIDKYSVGEYSLAHNLTLEQAQGILEIGMIYVPTKHIDSETHKETYIYNQDKVYEREFTPGYLYQWDYIADEDIKIGWLTVGESPSVYFSGQEPVVNDRLVYWYTDSDVVTDVNNNTGTYEPYTLYKWEEDHWFAVATLKGNVNSRAISDIYQTTNEVTVEITNARGNLNTLSARLDDAESIISATTEWVKGSDEDGKPLYNMTAIVQQSSQDESSLSLMVADANGNKVVSGANIVLNQNNNESSIYIDAEKILLGGTTTFVKSEGDVTKIDGSHIATGTLSADQITTGTLKSSECEYADGNTYANKGTLIDLETGCIRSMNFAIDESGRAYFNGDMKASQITSGQLGTDVVYTGDLSASQITTGELDAGIITVKNLDASWINTGSLDADKVSVVNLSADSITAGTMSADRIKGMTVTGDTISINKGYFGEFNFNDTRMTGDSVGMGSIYIDISGNNDWIHIDNENQEPIYYVDINGRVFCRSCQDTLSDRNFKYNIETLQDSYETVFDNLKPIRYKYNDGTSDRYHTGFIAQDVAEAVEKSGLTLQDFAAVCAEQKDTEDERWSVRYGELVSLNTWQIQKLKARVNELEQKNAELEERLVKIEALLNAND